MDTSFADSNVSGVAFVVSNFLTVRQDDDNKAATATDTSSAGGGAGNVDLPIKGYLYCASGWQRCSRNGRGHELCGRRRRQHSFVKGSCLFCLRTKTAKRQRPWTPALRTATPAAWMSTLAPAPRACSTSTLVRTDLTYWAAPAQCSPSLKPPPCRALPSAGCASSEAMTVQH